MPLSVFAGETLKDEILKASATANRAEFVREFQDYGMLLHSMDALEFAEEIWRQVPNPKHAAILATLAGKIFALREEFDRKG